MKLLISFVFQVAILAGVLYCIFQCGIGEGTSRQRARDFQDFETMQALLKNCEGYHEYLKGMEK